MPSTAGLVAYPISINQSDGFRMNRLFTKWPNRKSQFKKKKFSRHIGGFNVRDTYSVFTYDYQSYWSRISNDNVNASYVLTEYSIKSICFDIIHWHKKKKNFSARLSIPFVFPWIDTHAPFWSAALPKKKCRKHKQSTCNHHEHWNASCNKYASRYGDE